MAMKPFDNATVTRGPRCPMCLSFTPSVKWVARDECSPACLQVDITEFGQQAAAGHLHRSCDCGYVWATTTAMAEGMDPDRQ